MSYKLISGLDRNKASPESFLLPSDADKAAVGPGDYAKLIFSSDDGAERMWVLITARDGDSITGTLSNAPHRAVSVKHGDEVKFGPEHIIATLNQHQLDAIVEEEKRGPE
jgi:hypothetical protein